MHAQHVPLSRDWAGRGGEKLVHAGSVGEDCEGVEEDGPRERIEQICDQLSKLQRTQQVPSGEKAHTHTPAERNTQTDNCFKTDQLIE